MGGGKLSWKCKSKHNCIFPAPWYRVLHLPSQTNHAFQDIWRQLANYWRALAPVRQLGQPGSNSSRGTELKCVHNQTQNIFHISPRAPGLAGDTGCGSGARWCQDDVRMTRWLAPGDDTGQMTHDRWHNTLATLSFCLIFPLLSVTICLATWLGTVSGAGVKCGGIVVSARKQK